MYWQGESLMLNPHEAFGIVSGMNKLMAVAATSFVLAACGDRVKEPELPSSVFAGLNAKPTESYVMVPYVKAWDDKSEPIRKHKLIIKISEMIDHKAINAQGKPGTNFCSGFQVANAVTDDKGKLHAVYKTAAAARCLVPIEFKDNSLMQLASTIDTPSSCNTKSVKAELESVIRTHCTFKPNAN